MASRVFILVCVVLHCRAETALYISGGNLKGVPLKMSRF
jgi:hypothetical protein